MYRLTTLNPHHPFRSADRANEPPPRLSLTRRQDPRRTTTYKMTGVMAIRTLWVPSRRMMARKEGGKEGRREEGGGWNSELSMNIKRTCYKGAASWAQTTKSTALCLSTTKLSVSKNAPKTLARSPHDSIASGTRTHLPSLHAPRAPNHPPPSPSCSPQNYAASPQSNRPHP